MCQTAARLLGATAATHERGSRTADVVATVEVLPVPTVL